MHKICKEQQIMFLFPVSTLFSYNPRDQILVSPSVSNPIFPVKKANSPLQDPLQGLGICVKLYFLGQEYNWTQHFLQISVSYKGIDNVIIIFVLLYFHLWVYN